MADYLVATFRRIRQVSINVYSLLIAVDAE
jgi:hypothetical protein